MSIALVGLSFRTAPVALREQVTRTYAALEPSFAAPNGEMVVLSTCNRFEVYVADDQPSPEAALERARAMFGAGMLAAPDTLCGEDGEIIAGCSRRELSLADRKREPLRAVVEPDCAARDALVPHLYSYTGEAVASHLFAVAAGLDSMVVGEAQILGQVGDALQHALAQGTAGRQLSMLFRYAISAGRRARNETSIGHGSGSVSHAAVALARQTLGDLATRRVLLIGAGKMAEIAAHTLAEHAVGAVRVLNRDAERAAAVAATIGGDWCGWEQLPDALAWADVVITSTGAPHTLIHAQTVAELLPQRESRSLLIIDLAVPRDVDRAVGDLPGVQLADIDDLYAAIETGLQQREEAVPAARRVVAQEVARYAARMAALDVAPTIADLREHAEQIRAGEVQKALRKLGALSPQEQRAVEALSVAIVNKLLHGPTVELKRHAADTRFTQTTRTLFGLEPDVE